MKKNTLDNLFKELEGCFDIHETPSGHQKRFLEKLNVNQKTSNNSRTSWWKPLSIAASLAVIIAIGAMFLNSEPLHADLASVSPEMEQTQSFFTTTINEELRTLKSFETAETKVLVDDALIQLSTLEMEYETLKIDLKKSGNDKRVIYAMIANFQNRIDLLQQVIETIEEIKTLKANRDETTI